MGILDAIVNAGKSPYDRMYEDAAKRERERKQQEEMEPVINMMSSQMATENAMTKLYIDPERDAKIMGIHQDATKSIEHLEDLQVQNTSEVDMLRAERERELEELDAEYENRRLEINGAYDEELDACFARLDAIGAEVEASREVQDDAYGLMMARHGYC